MVRGYLEEIELRDAPLTRATAERVADAVREDFLVDEERFEAVNIHNRPFLRDSTAILLESREGLCGEGTRVIVNLLNELGFDATRVTLFNTHLESSHTLVSVLVDGQEVLIDSINSPPEITDILKAHTLTARHFQVLHYTDDLQDRRELAAADRVPRSDGTELFFYHFWLYSYEAIPYAKLLTTLGIDVRVFSFQRPYRWISSLAEKPSLIWSVLWFGVGTLFIAGLVWWRARHPVARARTAEVQPFKGAAAQGRLSS